MLRGISGVDIVMLVIAADDGPMPQTREHLNILSLLNIKYGLVIITKIDLVDQHVRENNVLVDFFGQKAATTRSVATLSLKTDAPVIMLFSKTFRGWIQVQGHLG